MNRLIARSAMAFFLLLTALLLTCATATAATLRYKYNNQDGEEEILKVPDPSVVDIKLDEGDAFLSDENPDGPDFYFDSTGSFPGATEVNIVEGDVCLLLASGREAYPPFYVWDDASLTFYNEENFSGTRYATSICLGAGSTLNLNSANLNLSGSISYSSSSFESATATVNIYGGTNTIAVSDEEGKPGIGQGIELNIFGGEISITGGGGQPALDCTSLTFSPSSGSYILVYDGVDKNTRTLIGAYNQSNSDGVLDTLRKYTALSMEKAAMSTIVIDTKQQTHYVDDNPHFEVKALPDGVSGFTVLYRKTGTDDAWANAPTTAGTYDVRITRAADDTYATVNQVIPGGLLITKRSRTAPTGVAAVAETLAGTNDGRLTGVTATMEYRAEDSSDYSAVTGTEVTGLAPGTYFVRYKETATHFASDDVEVEVASGRVAYRITHGDGASLIVGQNTTLSFTANGPLAKLTAVLVDGKTLDAAHYTAESGSTIITLAADYVKTLAMGEHTLTVRYTDGETSARFTVTAMPQNLPQTGDGSRLTAWVAVLGASCAGLWCLNRRRR